MSREIEKSITSINLAVNKMMVTDAAEKLVNEIYEYLSEKGRI
ncbi:hypothetical protein [Pediococcus claussenii]|uniref:Uncharacterized protein n=1 Tax=Pediococcus claussenii (strain ATCC BAA-344 / DSM 14800 / JCM 18046 / KCTC 3811 / LMG 21948 / P06) TaxID=701521 RepID=G8PD16_PEDCP|nr:hypothetical protein [Pediococcus claussenii]AEV95151.1 hypothetical protein PECL_879 [Pediococcus claussenii ATCC BAA-344]